MLVAIITACAPVLVALIGIIPTIIANRKATQASIEESAKATGEQVQHIQRTLDAHIQEDADDNQRNRRYRILRFFDEMCEGRRHSESHFEDILDDIDAYEAYCTEHPDYHNNRGHVAMMKIKEAYAKIKSNGEFLTHSEEE